MVIINLQKQKKEYLKKLLILIGFILLIHMYIKIREYTHELNMMTKEEI